MKNLIILVLPLFLGGCFQATFFTKAEESGVPSGEVLLWYPSGNRNAAAPDAPQGPQALIQAFLKDDPDAEAKLDECYVPPRPAIAPVAIPLITALAKLGFDSIVDQKARALDELKARSIQTYGTTEFMNTLELRSWPCLGVARITKNHPNKGDNTLGMMALFEIVHFDALGIETGGREARDPSKALGMRLRPLFVRSFDAVAVTKEGETDKPEVISLSFALALKGIEDAPGKLPQTIAFGAGTLSVSKVKIGRTSGETKICKEKDCGSTGLIPLPPKPGPLELSMAVTETGNVGFNIDLAKAQLAAFKAAMGPALSSALKTKLTED